MLPLAVKEVRRPNQLTETRPLGEALTHKAAQWAHLLDEDQTQHSASDVTELRPPLAPQHQLLIGGHST
eukprot:11198675-Lingulodinium_polyedra.AAC.1